MCTWSSYCWSRGLLIANHLGKLLVGWNWCGKYASNRKLCQSRQLNAANMVILSVFVWKREIRLDSCLVQCLRLYFSAWWLWVSWVAGAELKVVHQVHGASNVMMISVQFSIHAVKHDAVMCTICTAVVWKPLPVEVPCMRFVDKKLVCRWQATGTVVMHMYVCMYRSGRGPAYSGPIRWGLYIASPLC